MFLKFRKIFVFKTYKNRPFFGRRPLVTCACSYVCYSCLSFTSLVVFMHAPASPVLPSWVLLYLV
jgi:hypothetical protein